jgi:carboxymethylenebutenolidase
MGEGATMHTINDITYTTRDGENFTGILAEPDGDGKVPGILYITAIWGIDASACDITAGFADDGFIVSTPDIFWRQHPGPTEDREIAQARYAAYDFEQGSRDMQDLIAHLRAHPRSNGKVALLGICFGGRYAHVGAADWGLDAAASYHSTKIDLHLDAAARIKCPVSHHFGSQDAAVPMDVVAQIQEAYTSVPGAEIVVHQGAEHNFSMPHKPAYNPAVARSAHESVLRCFRSM